MKRINTFAILALLCVSGACRLDAAGIVVDEETSGCKLVGNWADSRGDNPEGKSFSSGGTVGGGYHYTSSHGRYRRTGKERSIWTPKLPKAGRYRVEVSWRGTENRSSRVTYEIRYQGSTRRKTVSQRTKDMTWERLGVFPFAAGSEGSVAMVSDGGSSACADAARFTFVGEGGETDDGGGDTPDGLDDVLDSGPATSDGTIRLDKNKQGEATFVFAEDGTARITALLETYGPARLSVTVTRTDGTTARWASWARQDDKDPALLEVEGRAIEGSNRKVGDNDWTPVATTQRLEGKKGDKVILKLEGSFGAANPFLEVEGPGEGGE